MTLPFPLDGGFDPNTAAANAKSYTWDGAKADFAVWDDPEFVQYTSAATNPPGDQQLGSIGPVYRLNLNIKEMASSGGVYVSLDRKWVVPNLLVKPRRLKPHDYLLDEDGVRWTVLSADLPPRDPNWNLVCRNLVLVHELNDTVTILTSRNTQDPAGTRIANLTPTYVNVAARIQEQHGEQTDERGQRVTGRYYTVYLDRRVVVSQEDTVADQATGTIYEIKGYANPDRIDVLMELHCEKRGWR